MYQPFTVISSGKIIIRFWTYTVLWQLLHTWWATATMVHIVWDDSLLECVTTTVCIHAALN